MQITLTNTGKRYNREWIFRHLDYQFIPSKTYAITGSNGSGKSTLLQVIAGAIMHSEGKVAYGINNTDPEFESPLSNIKKTGADFIDAEKAYKNISIATPYLDLIEEMTALEFLDFHSTFKKLTRPVPEILAELTLEKTAHKQIRYFSSGMKQRLKLAQAFFTDTPVLLLDEPTTNLDHDGITLYHQLIKNYTKEKLLIISSNDKEEYMFCEEAIAIGDYK